METIKIASDGIESWSYNIPNVKRRNRWSRLVTDAMARQFKS